MLLQRYTIGLINYLTECNAYPLTPNKQMKKTVKKTVVKSGKKENAMKMKMKSKKKC